MFKQLLNKKLVKNEKGLTLIELLAVIVILAIISAIAIPAIGNIIDNSRDKAIISEGLNIIAGAKIAKMDGVCSDTGCTQDQLKGYVEGVTKGKTTETPTYSVAYSAGDATTEPTWTLTFSKFADTKSKKYQVTGTPTEEALKNLIDQKK